MFKVTDAKSRRNSFPLDSSAQKTKTEVSTSPKPKLSLTHPADISKGETSSSQRSPPRKKTKKPSMNLAQLQLSLTRRFRIDVPPAESVEFRSYKALTSEASHTSFTPAPAKVQAQPDPGKQRLPPTHFKTHILTLRLPSLPKPGIIYEANLSSVPPTPSKLSVTVQKNQQIHVTITLPKPSLNRYLYPIEEVDIMPGVYTPKLAITDTSAQASDFLTSNRPSEAQTTIEHEQLLRTLSTSASYRSESVSTPDGKLFPTNRLSAAEQEKILSWFWGWTRENCRHEKIDEAALLKVRQQIQAIHDHKGYRLLGKIRDIWDIRASYQYHQAALDFYEAAGISKKKQHIAALHWAKSGEFYALTQIFLLPIRVMGPLFHVPGFDTIFAKASINLARGLFHANAGGVLSPAFDVLAAFTKKGKPFPSSVYWRIPSHYGAVQQLEHCIRQVSNLLEDCRTQRISVPAELIDYLERARSL